MKMGHIISKLRYEKGYNQMDMAEKLGVTKGAVGMWETDSRKPDYDTLVKIADLFNVTTDYLLSHSVRTQAEELSHTDELTHRLNKTFSMLDEDNKDILIGKAKELLKEQRKEEKYKGNPSRTAKAT